MKKTLADIEASSKLLFGTQWNLRSEQHVLASSDIMVENGAVALDAAILYADLAGSTELLERFPESFAASVVKSFLHTACAVATNNGGKIVSFDGDRVMAVFIGDTKCSNSAKTGLQIASAIRRVNQVMRTTYPARAYQIDFAVGIAVGDLFVVRAGIRDANDLLWIGVPANYAAKLSKIRGRNEKVFITDALFKRLNDNSKYGGEDHRCMWTEIQTSIIPRKVWGSPWLWNF